MNDNLRVEFREISGKLRLVEVENRKLQSEVVELSSKVAMSKNTVNFSAQYEQQYYTLQARLKELEQELRNHKETVVQKPQTQLETEEVEVVDQANVGELQRTLKMLMSEQDRLNSVLERNETRNSELVTMRSEVEIEKLVTTGQMRGTKARDVVHYSKMNSASLGGSNVNMSNFNMGQSYASSTVVSGGKAGMGGVLSKAQNVATSSSGNKVGGVSGGMSGGMAGGMAYGNTSSGLSGGMSVGNTNVSMGAKMNMGSANVKR